MASKSRQLESELESEHAKHFEESEAWRTQHETNVCEMLMGFDDERQEHAVTKNEFERLIKERQDLIRRLEESEAKIRGQKQQIDQL